MENIERIVGLCTMDAYMLRTLLLLLHIIANSHQPTAANDDAAIPSVLARQHWYRLSLY